MSVTQPERIRSLLARARDERPPEWIAEPELAAFFASKVAQAEAGGPDLNAGDLYLAFACMRGNADAIGAFEREHLSRVGEFVASMRLPPATIDELKQRVRERLLVPDRAGVTRMASYSGRGS